MTDMDAVLQILYFFVPAYFANMSPVLVRRWFNALAVPLDGGRFLWGKRILGDHKTWRGLLAGIVAGILVFELQRLIDAAGFARNLALIDYSASPLLPGFLMGLGAGVGDAVKSFFKRRINIAPGASWLGFDQLDFFVGAYAFVSLAHLLPLMPTLMSIPIVLLSDMAINVIGYCLGLKDAWI